MTTLTFHHDFAEVFRTARIAVYNVNKERYDYETGEYVRGSHFWFTQIMRAYDLHPVIDKIINHGVRPVDWHLLLLEWPHVSEDDETQIAYTRNEAAGQSFLDTRAKRLTRTSIGKYLARHWPHVADHIRRDWAGTFGQHKYEIWDTKEMIISGIELGPQSCMKSSYGSIPFTRNDNRALVTWHTDKTTHVNWNHHPYAVYAPELGWRMAVRLDPGKPDIVMGRGLLNVDSMSYVRTYKRGEDEGSYSHTDERLEAWLKDKGYARADSWEDHKTLRLDHPNGGIMMPYLDGGCQRVDVYDDKRMQICYGGDYECDATNAQVSETRETYGTCEDCDETIYEDDDARIWVGQYEDTLICGSCASDYTCVRGARRGGGNWRNYMEYYIRSNDVLEINGTEYDPDNLPDNIVEMADGDYEDKENCVLCADDEWRLTDDCVEIDGNWYHEDDEDIVECADNKWRLRENCWECAHSGDWYSNDEPHVDLSDGTYHPDALRELADNA